MIPSNERTVNPLLPLATEFKRLSKLSKAPALFERDNMSNIISNIQRYLGRVRILLRVASNLLYDVPRKSQEKENMAYDARNVANQFLRLARANGRVLTNMQLQKLVYIAHGYSLAILHKPLIRQSAQAWRYGPVIPDLYQALRQYGAGVVTKPIELGHSEELSETDQELLVAVTAAYGRFTGPQLSTMTHRAGTPWKHVYQPDASFNNDAIPNTLIEKHYTTLLDERAGINPA